MSFTNIYNAQKNMSDFLIDVYQNKRVTLRREADVIAIEINTHQMINAKWREYLQMLEKDQVNVLMSLYLTSRIFGAGPKVYEPTSLMLESMEAIDLNIGVDDYEQPFPTMVIEFPDNYSKIAYDPVHDKEHKVDFIVLDRVEDIIIIGVHFNTNILDESQIFTFPIYTDKEGVIIEDFLKEEGKIRYKSSLPVDSSEEQMAYTTSRAAMNCCMSLMEYGIKKIGYKNQSYAQRLEERIKRKVRVQENRKELNGLPVYYTLDQDIRLYETKTVNRSGQGLGHALRPHWRRGYRRRQHHGPKNELVKIVTIKPVLIHSDQFLGHSSDSQYRLH